MNKGDLVEVVSAESGLTKKASGEAIDAITSVISGALGKGEKVTLVGFGAFQVVRRKARTGRNPQTGATLQISGKNVPKFKAGKNLKDRVK